MAECVREGSDSQIHTNYGSKYIMVLASFGNWNLVSKFFEEDKREFDGTKRLHSLLF
jgi:hypothetical protein